MPSIRDSLSSLAVMIEDNYVSTSVNAMRCEQRSACCSCAALSDRTTSTSTATASTTHSRTTTCQWSPSGATRASTRCWPVSATRRASGRAWIRSAATASRRSCAADLVRLVARRLRHGASLNEHHYSRESIEDGFREDTIGL